MIIPAKHRPTRGLMAAAAAKLTDRAIMIRRMEGICRALHRSVKDKGGRRRGKGNLSNQAARHMYPGGLIDGHKAEFATKLL